MSLFDNAARAAAADVLDVFGDGLATHTDQSSGVETRVPAVFRADYEELDLDGIPDGHPDPTA